MWLFEVFAWTWALMLTWPFLLGIAFITWTFDHNECNWWSLWCWIGTVAVAYFYFTPDWTIALAIGLAYVPLGILWSIWRYKRYVDEKLIQIKRETNIGGRKDKIERLHPKRMKTTITGWVLLWPPSVVDMVAGDLIDGINWLIRRVFRFAYMGIYDKALNSIPKEEEKKAGSYLRD